MNYNVLGRKLKRGLSVVNSVTILKGRVLAEEEYFIGPCPRLAC